MKKLIEKYFKSKNIAVVGVSSSKNKFGYKVFNFLNEAGYNVFPVHPTLKQIDGVKVYKNLSEIEENIEAVSIIIPPDRCENVIEEIKIKKIPIVWFQPGSESYKLIRFCNTHSISVIYNKCVMVEFEGILE